MDETRLDYSNPKESVKSGEESCHVFKLLVKDNVIGEAKLIFYTKQGLHAYLLVHMSVDHKSRGSGFGSKLIEAINDFLVKKKAIGLLVDSIQPDSAAKGLYERHGWVRLEKIGHPHWLVFCANPSKDLHGLVPLLNQIDNSFVRPRRN